jgi:hypothetical protein
MTAHSIIFTAFLAGATILAAGHAVAQNTWTTGTPMPTAVQWPAVGAVGTHIFVVGGMGAGGIVSINQIYNTKTNDWTTGTPDRPGAVLVLAPW